MKVVVLLFDHALYVACRTKRMMMIVVLEMMMIMVL